MGFKFWSSWGSWSKISELQQVGDFSKNGSQLHRRNSEFLRPYFSVGLNVARYLTVSLRGPAQAYITRREAPSYDYCNSISGYEVLQTTFQHFSLNVTQLCSVELKKYKYCSFS